MFESMTDRIAGTFLMGLDVAVEFATLGEFRLVDSDPGSASIPFDLDAAPLMRRPARSAAAAADRSLLPGPSTAVARATQQDDTPPIRLRMPPRSPLRAVVPPARSRTRPATPIRVAPRAAPRSRSGAVAPGTQLCLFSR